MHQDTFEIRSIGRVESPLTDSASAPKQGDEGAPDAWLASGPAERHAPEGAGVGDTSVALPGLPPGRGAGRGVRPGTSPSRPRGGR